ncbi:hypothetical protein J6590_016482 [Homalodisca vitripennis]|nr:hypothetical protein J6590_016482 [Homalodisca vitripennis]
MIRSCINTEYVVLTFIVDKEDTKLLSFCKAAPCRDVSDKAVPDRTSVHVRNRQYRPADLTARYLLSALLIEESSSSYNTTAAEECGNIKFFETLK